MTIKLPVDVNTLDDETLSLLIDESKKALDERNKYVPFVGEIIEVWDGDNLPNPPYLRRLHAVLQGKAYSNHHGCHVKWKHYRRLDPTRILQFRDHEPGPCPCPDEEWVHVMWDTGVITTVKVSDIDWSHKGILRWCPAVGVE